MDRKRPGTTPQAPPPKKHRPEKLKMPTKLRAAEDKPSTPVEEYDEPYAAFLMRKYNI